MFFKKQTKKNKKQNMCHPIDYCTVENCVTTTFLKKIHRYFDNQRLIFIIYRILIVFYFHQSQHKCTCQTGQFDIILIVQPEQIDYAFKIEKTLKLLTPLSHSQPGLSLKEFVKVLLIYTQHILTTHHFVVYMQLPWKPHTRSPF